MKRHKDPFTDEELTRAAGLVRQSMLDLLPGPEECEHQFSPQFQEKMDPLLRKGKRRPAALYVRRAAAVFLAVLLGGGLLLRMNPTTWSAFLRWTREDETGRVTYYFSGERTTEELPQYRLSWIPEGYEAVDIFEDDKNYGVLYQIGDDLMTGFVFECYLIPEAGLHRIEFDPEDYICKTVTVNGWPADFYLSLTPDETSGVFWINEDENIVFEINGFLEESVIMRMAESIILAD